MPVSQPAIVESLTGTDAMAGDKFRKKEIMRTKVMQDWMDHQDGCIKCQLARNASGMCETGKEMSPEVEQEIRHSMAQELSEQEDNHTHFEIRTASQALQELIDTNPATDPDKYIRLYDEWKLLAKEAEK